MEKVKFGLKSVAKYRFYYSTNATDNKARF